MKDNKFDVIGHISWLWSCSSLHRTWPMSVFAINTLPAILNQQFILLMSEGYPVGYCSWANLDIVNEVKYINDTNSLISEDWNSGDRSWFIDWIAPFGHHKQLYNYVREKFPNKLFRAIRVSDKYKKGRITEFYGRDVDRVVARRKFIQYHHELLTYIKNHPY
ncbi:toxin-activating lysine-acyltransferase [Salmonella enterica]|nr:toxin-activating lysine-acyltransferase [Salmonella enterica]EKF0974716.1 toxin-activating lysine-acyltransferase [Salmonella enterica]